VDGSSNPRHVQSVWRLRFAHLLAWRVHKIDRTKLSAAELDRLSERFLWFRDPDARNVAPTSPPALVVPEDHRVEVAVNLAYDLIIDEYARRDPLSVAAHTPRYVPRGGRAFRFWRQHLPRPRGRVLTLRPRTGRAPRRVVRIARRSRRLARARRSDDDEPADPVAVGGRR
jgi:hypothetical protein